MTDDEPEPEGRPLGRRAFLVMVGAGLTSLAWGGSALDVASKSTLVLPEPIRRAIPVGEGWRIYAVNPPHARRSTRRPGACASTGSSSGRSTLTYDELLALPGPRRSSDFHCVTGWSVDDVRWAGVRFGDLLAAAGRCPAPRALAFVSLSGRTSTR